MHRRFIRKPGPDGIAGACLRRSRPFHAAISAAVCSAAPGPGASHPHRREADREFRFDPEGYDDGLVHNHGWAVSDG